MRPSGSTTTRAVALGFALSCACGRTTTHAGPDPLPPAAQQQQRLGVDASADFTFCFCHHGFGPGFHGDVTVTLSSASTVALRLFIPRLEVESAGADGGRHTWATHNRLTGSLRLSDGTSKPASELTLAPREVVTFVVNPLSAYFDGPQTFAEVERADLLRVVLSVDGREELHESRALVMRQEP